METTLTKTAAEAISSPSSAPWIELPGDVTANILQRLGARVILESAQKVCTTWRNVCLDPSMWRVIELGCTSSLPEVHKFMSVMCRCAVDRSQGQLIDLKISLFGDDELIHYILDRSSNLHRLTIANCFRISGTALSEAVKKLPHLEELHLILMRSVHAKDFEAVGISCPMLKSFTYNGCPTLPAVDEPTKSKLCNAYALAIGKTMPNLRHLHLLTNRMTNEGLVAILDGCPHVESLDIRKCSGLDLTGALGKRCSEQIKNLRGPSDPICDFSWAGVSEKFIVAVRTIADAENYDSDFDFDFDDDDDDYGFYVYYC